MDPREHFCDQCKPIWDSAKGVLKDFLHDRERTIVRDQVAFAAMLRSVVSERKAMLDKAYAEIEPWDTAALHTHAMILQELEGIHQLSESMFLELAIRGEHIQLDTPPKHV
jgi:hypothetical protein